jgi:universal stress protein A
MDDYTHILVAIDFSASAEQVLNKARDIASRNNARLSLLHVVEYLPPIDSVYEPVLSSNWVIDDAEMLAQAKTSLNSFRDQQKLSDVELHTIQGTPKHIISSFVKQHSCDLVVMGSHGRHGINRLLGSTANAVLHDMPCDILAVKIDA